MSPMWSSEKSDNNKNNKSFSSSTSSTCSSSSTPSPFSSNPKPLKTMEEVWKDINVPCLPREDGHITNNINFPGVNLQDFLAQPFAKNHSPATTHHVFNLNSCPDFNFDQPNSSNALPFEEFASNSTSTKKRRTGHDENMGDRRYKRMIKNRESAARSRARKQAYRFELEGEVAILKEENRILKEQQELQLRLEEASQLPTKQRLEEASQLPTKHTLSRASSAPF